MRPVPGVHDPAGEDLRLLSWALTNSLIPVIYIGLGLNICFSIFLVRGFLNSIPREIDRGRSH